MELLLLLTIPYQLSLTLPLCSPSEMIGRTVGRGPEMMLEERRQAVAASVAGFSGRDTQDADEVAGSSILALTESVA